MLDLVCPWSQLSNIDTMGSGGTGDPRALPAIAAGRVLFWAISRYIPHALPDIAVKLQAYNHTTPIGLRAPATAADGSQQKGNTSQEAGTLYHGEGK